MCILFLYANGNPTPGSYKLILASNRDEDYTRPAASAGKWPEAPYVIGGMDLEPGKEGGTWLALSEKDGIIKVATLLSITGEIKQKDVIGRGEIVTNYVKGDKNNEIYCKELLDNGKNYNGFNVVTVELKNDKASIINCSNAKLSSPSHISSNYKIWPECECYGFGNSPIHTPFKKVQKGKELFENIVLNYNNKKNNIIQNKTELIDKLINLLKEKTKYWPDDELYKRAPNWSKDLCSLFVRIPNSNYGTRTNTVILIDSNNKMDFYEETMLTNDPDGEWKKTHIEVQF